MTAIAALTAQNTLRRDRASTCCRRPSCSAQIQACFDDIGVDAVKLGMLAMRREIVDGGRRGASTTTGCRNVVLDPVMVASSGDRAARAETALDAWCASCFRCAHVVTPEHRRGGAAGRPCDRRRRCAREAAWPNCSRWARRAVLLKGGHLPGRERGRPAGRGQRRVARIRRTRAPKPQRGTAPAARCRRRSPRNLALGRTLARSLRGGSRVRARRAARRLSARQDASSAVLDHFWRLRARLNPTFPG